MTGLNLAGTVVDMLLISTLFAVCSVCPASDNTAMSLELPRYSKCCNTPGKSITVGNVYLIAHGCSQNNENGKRHF